jgi:hemolysin type calcium-binding protein
VSDGVHDPVLSPATSLTVYNVAPTASVSGPAAAVRGQSRSFLLQAADVVADAATGFTYVVDWGDGSAPQTVAAGPGNGSGVTIAHVFASSRVYVVHVTAADKDGQTGAAATHTVRIDIAAVQPDPLDPDKRVLVVGGSTGNDKIDIKPEKGKHTDDDEILVKINEREMGRFRRKAHFEPPIDSIVVYGQAGDDKITVASQIDIPAYLFGDDGDDELNAGGGPTTLVGGDGDDDLEGGDARNVLIGGRGEDRLKGKAGDDLLIGGLTFFDEDLAALSAIMAEWSSGRDYAARVANVRGDASSPYFSAARANGNVFLKSQGPQASVFDDGQRDKLAGSAGRDWFFAMLGSGKDSRDKLTDLLGNELVDELL